MAVLSRVYDEFLTTSAEHLLVGQGKFGARPRYPLRLLWLPFLPHPESGPFL
jgi:hypothetical protein